MGSCYSQPVDESLHFNRIDHGLVDCEYCAYTEPAQQ